MRRVKPMSLTLRSLSAMLAYPNAELCAAIPELREAIDREQALSPAHRAALEPLFQRMEGADLYDLQADYSELFDTGRRLSLNLFEHVHGDSRDRGPAMHDLGQHYLDHGFVPVSKELPDFLPLFLEFVSQIEPAEARSELAEPASVLQALAERLAERETPYAALLDGLVALAGVAPDRERIAEMDKDAARDLGKSVDELWEEAPVSFSTPHDNPTGMIARIRAFNRRRKAAEEPNHV